MRKIIKLFSIITLFTLILVGCSNSDENNAKKVAKEFVTKLYTVDTKKINDYNSLLKSQDAKAIAESIQSHDKSIISLMTDEAYKTLVANRDNVLSTEASVKGDYTLEVTQLTLTKTSSDSKENKLAYSVETKLKFISNKDKTEKNDVCSINIGLLKENGQWKVSTYKTTELSKLIAESLKK
jgi:uncharacterized lipoprotein NlpE involved in copper resistance